MEQHISLQEFYGTVSFSKLIDTYCDKTDLQTKDHFTAGYTYADFVVVLNEKAYTYKGVNTIYGSECTKARLFGDNRC